MRKPKRKSKNTRKIATDGKAKINVIGYQVARYEQMNKERTYILVEEVIE